MPSITKKNLQSTAPIWAQDALNEHSTLVAGGHLEKAQFTLPNPDGQNVVYSGTLVGRTYAEKDAGLGFGPANIATDEQIFLVIYDVDFDNQFLGADGHCSLYRHLCQVAEKSLPGWATMPAATKAKIRSLYQVI
jgi:hypothetical protein